jgi:prepilin-type N-terminal cleavage/methylation domain-containing protein
MVQPSPASAQKPTGRATRAPQRLGFTLIELLVVISIIALLAAMLLPVLGKAKHRAHQTVDLNNLRQVNTAVHLFTSDNEERLPWPNWYAGEAETPQQGWLYTLDKTASGTARFKLDTGSFWPLLRDPKLFFCPSDNTNTALFRLRGQQISSYVMNGGVCGYGKETTAQKIAQMSPTAVTFWECADKTVQDNQVLFNDGASSPDENTSGRHGSVAVYGAFDGAARLMKISLWENKAAEIARNDLWCYPTTDSGR